MSSRFRNALLSGVVIALSVSSAVANHHQHEMPGIQEGFVITLHPGEQVTIDCSFHAVWEECLQIFDHKSAKMLKVWKNFEPGEPGQWKSEKNTTQETQVLLLVGRHKRSAPNGAVPWQLSNFGLLDQTQSTRLIGWDDSGGDKDFNDVRAFVRWIKEP